MTAFRTPIFACLTALSALFLSSGALADEPKPVMTLDEGAYPPSPVRTKLVLAGVGMTGVFYGGALGASYLWETDPGAEDLRLPYVGPWLKLSQTTLCTPEMESAGCNDFLQVGGAVLAVFSGLGQLAGTGFLLEALFMTTSAAPAKVALRRDFTDQARRDALDSPLTLRQGDVSMTPVPLVGAASELGISLVGTF